MSDSAPQYPRMKRGFSLVPLEDGAALLRSADRSLVMRGEAAVRLLPQLCPLLDGTRTVGEIAAALTDVADSVVQEAIDLFARRGLLEVPIPMVLGQGDQELATFTDVIDGRGDAVRSLGEARVLAIGDRSGLCEVVERDAVMIMWWNRLPAPEIQVPADSWLAKVVAERFTIPGVSFRLFDITTDSGTPTVFCVAAEARDNGCAVACGAATRPDPAEAALKALVEAAQTRSWVRSLTRQYGPPDTSNDFGAITTFEDHVRLYGQPHMKAALGFLVGHRDPITLANLSQLLSLSYGVTGGYEFGESNVQLVRAAPSAGGLYPIELYAIVRNAADLEAGVYHYNLPEHARERLPDRPHLSESLETVSHYTNTLTSAPVLLVLTAVFARNTFKYGDRGYRFVLFDAGHVAQNLLLVSAAMGLGAVPIGGFRDDQLSQMVGSDGVNEAAIYRVSVGRPTGEAAQIAERQREFVSEGGYAP